jgi:hypothetical protein
MRATGASAESSAMLLLCAGCAALMALCLAATFVALNL